MIVSTLPIVFVITGPTSVGKSSLVFELSKKFPIEVISADSQQIYRYMCIGTAQPSTDVLKQLKHHLVAFTTPSEKYSAGKFIKDTSFLIQDIIQRGKIPFIVGGSFFYIQSLWDGLMDEPHIDINILNEINNMPHIERLELLKVLDPISYSRIHPNNIPRIQRALLISKSSQQPFSSFKRTNGIYDQYCFHSFQLERDKEEVHKTIEQRVYDMFDMGWMHEIYTLLQMGYSLKDPGLNALGYKEIILWLNENNYPTEHLLSLPQNEKDLLISMVIQKTKKFAKKQWTWFRNSHPRSDISLPSPPNRLKKVDYTKAYDEIVETLSRKKYEK